MNQVVMARISKNVLMLLKIEAATQGRSIKAILDEIALGYLVECDTKRLNGGESFDN